MDSREFTYCETIEQRGMVERGEVMPALRIDPIPGLQSGCFWCGAARDVLLFGRLRSETKKAFGMRQLRTTLREVITDVEPCETCKELMDREVCFMEFTRPDKLPEPTGRYWVVPEASVRALVAFDSLTDEIIRQRKSWISREVARHVGFYDAGAAG